MSDESDSRLPDVNTILGLKPKFSDLQTQSTNPLVQKSAEFLKVMEFEFTCSNCGRKSRTGSDKLPKDWQKKIFVLLTCNNCGSENRLQVAELARTQMQLKLD